MITNERLEKIRAHAEAAMECFKSARTERDAKRYVQRVIDAINVELALNPDPVKHMVDRFLGWRLPKDFRPDDGISYTPPLIGYGPAAYQRSEMPTGTNLFSAAQATDMVQHMLDGFSATPNT